MNRDEFLSKYGEVLVKFSSYYKYSFSYSGILSDGKIISCSVGGNSDDIYRFGVSADTELTIASLSPYSGSVHENGEEIESFYDY